RYAATETSAIVGRALELGVTLFDTAEIYGIEARSPSCRALLHGLAVVDPARLSGFGHGERILGDALVEKRASPYVATKFYQRRRCPSRCGVAPSQAPVGWVRYRLTFIRSISRGGRPPLSVPSTRCVTCSATDSSPRWV